MALQKDRIGNGVAIVGAGTTGYLTTLYLCKNYPDQQFKWIYPEQNNPIGVGEATVPEVTDFLKDLGITPETIIKELNGSLKLGLKFKDFYKEGESFFHPFGNTDSESANLKYCIDNNVVPDDILKYDEIATHFDVRVLMSYLDETMQSLPNLTIERREIGSLDEIEEELVIDCTGFKRSLVDYDFLDITDKIPNNRALVYRAKYIKPEQKVPYTQCVAKNNGWVWEIPLGDQLSLGYVYDDKYNIKEEFIAHIKSIFGECDESKLIDIPMTTGRNNEHIVKKGNKTVISLGLSSFFIEPLESTGLYLVVFSIKTFDKWLNGEISTEDYNSIYNEEFDVVLDFIIAHYKFTTKDNEYWNQYKGKEVNLFRENNIFPQRSWNWILSGVKELDWNPETDAQALLKSKKYYEWVKTI